MAEKNVSDSIQGAAAQDTAQDYAGKGADAAREYLDRGSKAASDYANKGYDAAREYANSGLDVAARMRDNVTEFVRNEPWIAVAAAFAIGYVAARVMRRLSI
jgi:ElaB/YqjD/DUF883 family membrane-anchored ribosome-binding protein